MTDILSTSFSKLSPSLLKLLSNPVELLRGSNPVRCAHLLATHWCTQGPRRGVNHSRSCPTFLSLKFSESKVSWKFVLSKQGTWAPRTFQPWWLYYCTWMSAFLLPCHVFLKRPADRYSCRSRSFPHWDLAPQGGHHTPSWRALLNTGQRSQQSEEPKRVFAREGKAGRYSSTWGYKLGFFWCDNRGIS